MTPLHFQARDGARFSASPQGAQALSWRPAGSTESLLFNSPVSHAAQAQRGGVPVVFPQFAAQGPLPRHGLVRARDWQLVERRDDELALAVFRCGSGSDTLALWPHAFELELTLLAQGRVLEIELAVSNTGDAAFSFQAALHSYLQVGDVRQCAVAGLRDLRYRARDDTGEREGVQHSSQLELLNGRPVDRIVYGVGSSPLALHDHSSGSHTRSLLIQHEGFADAVIWNPGAEHGLSDLPDDCWQHFVCVEAAQIEQPLTLLPGEEWLGRQRLELA